MWKPIKALVVTVLCLSCLTACKTRAYTNKEVLERVSNDIPTAEFVSKEDLGRGYAWDYDIYTFETPEFSFDYWSGVRSGEFDWKGTRFVQSFYLHRAAEFHAADISSIADKYGITVEVGSGKGLLSTDKVRRLGEIPACWIDTTTTTGLYIDYYVEDSNDVEMIQSFSSEVMDILYPYWFDTDVHVTITSVTDDLNDDIWWNTLESARVTTREDFTSSFERTLSKLQID